MLINSGYQAINPDLDLSTQEWYTNAVDNYNQYNLTSSHVQHVIKKVQHAALRRKLQHGYDLVRR